MLIVWYQETVFYQICPLGLCGAPEVNDDIQAHRILKIKDFVPYLQELGIGAVYFNPVFNSDSHGYDTRDYNLIDTRLGTNEDFAEVCKTLHEHDIKVVLDGVFNHVGRGFFAFRDVQEKGPASPYANWFHINFDGDSSYGDGFWYEGWEGHYELVKLNLDNPDVQHYLLDAVDYWIKCFDIDGLRLDVAYSLPRWFMAMLSDHCKSLKQDFFMLGEVLGDNAGYMYTEAKLDAITDYPSYKAFWSSFNSLNMFEYAHTLKRNAMDMYRGRDLLTFVDNHDVNRISSTLTDERKLPLVFGLLMAVPGIPCIYYGSEWGIKGEKIQGVTDASLRPEFDAPQPNELSDLVSKYIHMRRGHKALTLGDYKDLVLTNKQYVLERNYEGEKIVVALNIDDAPYTIYPPIEHGSYQDLMSGEMVDYNGELELPPLSITYLYKHA